MIEEILIHNAKSGKYVTSVYGLNKSSTIYDVKKAIHLQKTKLPPNRQEVRLEQKSKGLKDADTLDKLGINSGNKLFVKDLGPQIGWGTVFFCEYAGPLVLYAWIYQRPWLFYGDGAAAKPLSLCTNFAVLCFCGHFLKRVLETQFVHRFSHGTMPIFNLFKNCSYYWGFAAYVAYHVNHPLFTPPCLIQTYVALGFFVFCEVGNLSVHIALKNLRPAGTKERRIPYPTSNPFTKLFDLVSCPNYTYEFGAWTAFTIMTQCLPAALFTLAGFYQMTVWALGKHRNYKKEFSNYPKGRKSIIPFII